MNSTGTRFIAIVNGVSCCVTIAFWALVYLRLFVGPAEATGMDRGSLASSFGFLVADMVWAVPLLIASVIGLLRARFWGWLTAQMVNILWFYTLTLTWVRDLYLGTLSPGAFLFLPFTLFAVWATVYLYRNRIEFGA